ncbi:MAG: radical SAM protein [bacterium]|nr:radical SAM protein [bacterium]
MSEPYPSYLPLIESSKFHSKVETAWSWLSNCRLCPRKCGVNRLEGEEGFCRSTSELVVSSAAPHFGEEPPLVGRKGSGTIFFTNCNLGCLYCQNYDISHLGYGRPVSVQDLADMMLSLQGMGCHNINLVTPTHFVPQILKALGLAANQGLRLPIVYNCGGYENIETLKLLDGIIDIYMPDAKYADKKVSAEYSKAPDYPEAMKTVLKEMHRQVGDLVIDEQGIAPRGLLIRHLVLPHGLAGTAGIMHFIAQDISRNSYVNIMAQYRPEYEARKYPLLSRSITREEYQNALNIARAEGLHRGFPDADTYWSIYL